MPPTSWVMAVSSVEATVERRGVRKEEKANEIAVLTEMLGRVECEARAANKSANVRGPVQRSNQKEVVSRSQQ